MNKNLRRSVVALAAALASLAFLATPTSASTHTATITGGTATFVNSTGASTFTTTLGGAPGAGCTSTLQIAATHTTGSGTIDVTVFTSIGHFIFNGSHWIAVITRTGSAAGSASGGVIGGAPLGDPTITFVVEIFPATSTAATSTSVDCTPRSAKFCTLRVNSLAIAGSYTAPTSDPTHSSIGSSSNYNVSSTSGGGITNVVGQTCGAPFNSFPGGAASISNMTGHVTN